MNRYTFKAKRKDNREWVYGNIIINPNSTDKIVIVENGVTSYSSTKEAILDFINDYVEIDKDTICQCTTREDKKDNIVYEYDIVSIKYEFEGKKLEAKATVMWDSCGMFYFEPLDENWIDDWNFQDDIGRFKIIGNKFDKEVE